MAKVTFEYTGEEPGRYQVNDGEGKTVVVESGSTFSTDDPTVIRELDAASHVVKRVTKTTKAKEE